jgi:hypothetical protein
MRIRLVALVSFVLVSALGCVGVTTPVSPSTAKPVPSDRLLAFQETNSGQECHDRGDP